MTLGKTLRIIKRASSRFFPVHYVHKNNDVNRRNVKTPLQRQRRTLTQNNATLCVMLQAAKLDIPGGGGGETSYLLQFIESL